MNTNDELFSISTIQLCKSTEDYIEGRKGKRLQIIPSSKPRLQPRLPGGTIQYCQHELRLISLGVEKLKPVQYALEQTLQ